jgi:hypothetical protein
MLVLFCTDPLRPRRPDDAYAAEATAAEAAGFRHALVSFEELVHDGDAERAVRRVPAQEEETLALYRGWMLRPGHYAKLYAALLARGVRLLNDPAAYGHCHHLPESYAAIAGHTPRSVWLPVEPKVEVDMDRVMDLLRPFGAGPALIKDYVKSRKHEWATACHIPSAADRTAVERIVRRFVELQGEDLAGGLVFREFVELELLGLHPRSGMPLACEYRTFVFDGAPLFTTEYWEMGCYAGEAPPPDVFTDVSRSIASRFFTMDVARRRNGDWLIIELGDAQVAGLPERPDAGAFYRALARRWPAE